MTNGESDTLGPITPIPNRCSIRPASTRVPNGIFLLRNANRRNKMPPSQNETFGQARIRNALCGKPLHGIFRLIQYHTIRMHPCL